MSLIGISSGQAWGRDESYKDINMLIREEGLEVTKSGDPAPGRAELLRALAKLMAVAVQLSASDMMHVFVNYSGHTDGLDIQVHPRDQKYQGKVERQYLLSAHIFDISRIPCGAWALDEITKRLLCLLVQEQATRAVEGIELPDLGLTPEPQEPEGPRP